jgi:hypothetical protein
MLYARLFQVIRAAHPEVRSTRIASWVWVVAGVIHWLAVPTEQSVHLSQIAQHTGDTEAVGRIAQVRRWLANKFIRVETFYEPLIQSVLQHRAGKPVFVLLDGGVVHHETL